MGLSNSKENNDTINWNNIKTDQISSTIPNISGISREANKLIEKLNFNNLNLEDTDSNDSSKEEIFLSKHIQQEEQDREHATHDNNLSTTSPFISSEMYNYIMNKYQKQNMVGGAKNKKSLEADSETSSTSSSDKEKEVHKSAKVLKNKTTKTNNKQKVKKSNKKSVDDFMNYLSSSAHTGGSLTDDNDDSVTNENTISVSSVRTSQINLISE